MFDSIGEKIKVLAKICFGLWLMLGMALGVLSIVELGGLMGFVVFMAIVAVCGVIGYVTVMILYAFGDVVANVENLNELLVYQSEVIANIDVNLVEVADVIEAQNGFEITQAPLTHPVRVNTVKKEATSVMKNVERAVSDMSVAPKKWRCVNCDTLNDEATPVCGGCGKEK